MSLVDIWRARNSTNVNWSRNRGKYGWFHYALVLPGRETISTTYPTYQIYLSTAIFETISVDFDRSRLRGPKKFIKANQALGLLSHFCSASFHKYTRPTDYRRFQTARFERFCQSKNYLWSDHRCVLREKIFNLSLANQRVWRTMRP